MSTIPATRRPATRVSWWDRPLKPFLAPGALLFSPVLITAPSAFAGESSPLAVYALSLLPFVFALCSLAFWGARWKLTTATYLGGIYVLLVVAAAVRGGQAGAISHNAAALEAVQVGLLALLGAFAFLREPRAEERARHLRALCWAPIVYVAVNVALHFAGVHPPGQYDTDSGLPATMLGLVGIDTHRVLFPMSGGLNGIGPTAVAALVISTTLALHRQQRRLAILGSLASLYVILAIDSRGALMFALLALALVMFTPRARRRGLGWVAIALPVLPILLVLALTSLAETDVGANLNRSGGEDISTATGRTVVWGEVTHTLAKPGLNQVFGYGRNGQLTSGASLGYYYLFRNDTDPLKHTAHSLILQTALDVGLVGVACLLILAAMVLRGLAFRIRDPYYAALFTATLALLLLGIVQSDPTPTHPDSFAFWLLVVFAAVRPGEA